MHVRNRLAAEQEHTRRQQCAQTTTRTHVSSVTGLPGTLKSASRRAERLWLAVQREALTLGRDRRVPILSGLAAAVTGMLTSIDN